MSGTMTRKVPTRIERKVLRDLRWYDHAALLDSKRPPAEQRLGSFNENEIVRRLSEETRQPERRVRKQVEGFLDRLAEEGVLRPWGPRATVFGKPRRSYWIDRSLLAEHYPTPQQETR